MKIELLYFDGCPHWVETRQLLSRALRDASLPDDVDLVEIDTAEKAGLHHFMGSPSIRINGVDIEPGAPDDGFNIECRLYWINGKPAGVPAREWIEAALARAGATS